MWLPAFCSKRLWLCALYMTLVVSLFIPGTASTQVALTLDPKRNMKFGTFAADIAGGGTVVLSPDADSVSFSGPITNFGGTVTRARFQIIGEPGAYVIVSLPSSITIRRGTSNIRNKAV